MSGLVFDVLKGRQLGEWIIVKGIELIEDCQCLFLRYFFLEGEKVLDF